MKVVECNSNLGGIVSSRSPATSLSIAADESDRRIARDAYLRYIAYRRNEACYEELLQRLMEKVIEMKDSLLLVTSAASTTEQQSC